MCVPPQVPLYLNSLSLLDVRFNRIEDVSTVFADHLAREGPLKLLASFNPLTTLRELGFVYGSAYDKRGDVADIVDASVSVTRTVLC